MRRATRPSLSTIVDSALLCCVLVSFWTFSTPWRRSLSAAGARPDVVEPGIVHAPMADGAGHTNVVLYLNSSCRFCTRSMPFYRRLALAVAQHSDVRLSAQSAERESPFRGYLERNGLSRVGVLHSAVPPQVRGTPTVVVYDPKGTVVASWTGVLSAEQEDTLLTLLR